VLGVLVEKQHTVPDTYPLTLNALVAGCNQKTSREPVLNAAEAEVQAATDHLRTLSLVIESSGGRVMRYAHNVERVLGVPTQAVALIAALMLRGPQTSAELRIGTERLHRFADISRSRAFSKSWLRARQVRWYCCCNASRVRVKRAGRICCRAQWRPVGQRRGVRRSRDAVTVSEIAALKANVNRLADDLAAVKATVAKLCAELGIAPP
jgi:uncharacterized protein YceH (UPF0502 family)